MAGQKILFAFIAIVFLSMTAQPTFAAASFSISPQPQTTSTYTLH